MLLELRTLVALTAVSQDCVPYTFLAHADFCNHPSPFKAVSFQAETTSIDLVQDALDIMKADVSGEDTLLVIATHQAKLWYKT
jgi:hypothetical protein